GPRSSSRETSTTNSCPSRFSCSKTPWKPVARIPRTSMTSRTGVASGIPSDRSRPSPRGAARQPESVGDIHRVDRGPDVVHPHAPHPPIAEVCAGHRGRHVPLERGSGLTLGAPDRPEEALAARADDDPVPLGHELREGGEELPVVLERLREAETGVDDDALRCDTGGDELPHPLTELGDDLAGDVAVGRAL